MLIGVARPAPGAASASCWSRYSTKRNPPWRSIIPNEALLRAAVEAGGGASLSQCVDGESDGALNPNLPLERRPGLTAARQLYQLGFERVVVAWRDPLARWHSSATGRASQSSA